MSKHARRAVVFLLCAVGLAPPVSAVSWMAPQMLECMRRVGSDNPAERDGAAAIRACKPLAMAGDGDAQYYLATAYWMPGPSREVLTGIMWYERSADLGVLGSSIALADYYYSGSTEPVDPATVVKPMDACKSRYWMERAKYRAAEFVVENEHAENPITQASRVMAQRFSKDAISIIDRMSEFCPDTQYAPSTQVPGPETVAGPESKL